MAQIVINEISSNYGYNIGTNSFATVALPITSCWGPGYFDPMAEISGPVDSSKVETMLENTVWRRFRATQDGLESFVSTYRGPSDCYRIAKDNSYQMAVTLIAAGYDVLTCRICPGTYASGVLRQISGGVPTENDPKIVFKAKYPGTFGNNLQIAVRKVAYFDSDTRTQKYYWNIITYVIDASGVKSSAENKSMVFNIENATDNIPYYKEVESDFWTIDGDVTGIVESETSPVPVWFDPAYGSLQNYVNLGTKQVVDADTDTDTDTDTEEDDPIFPAEVGTDYNTEKISKATTASVATAYATAKTAYNAKVATYEEAVVAYNTARQAWIDAGSPDSGATKTAMDSAKTAMDSAKTQMDTAKTAMVTAGTGVYDVFEDVIKPRFNWASDYQLTSATSSDYVYPSAAADLAVTNLNNTMQNIAYYQEWVRTHLVGLNLKDSTGADIGGVFDLLKDKLSYNHQRIISPGWDDQDFYMYTSDQSVIDTYTGQTDANTCMFQISPLHLKIMDVAYYSRCATGLIDTPKALERRYVHIEDPKHLEYEGYIQKLARVTPKNSAMDTNATLYHTHSAFFAPWGQYTYVGTSKLSEASPSFLAVMIQRAQILNQSIQYEWVLPTNRKHNLRIGKMQYTVPKKVLDQWQKLEGASVNVITTIPDLGTNIWGNSTLYEVPPVTYQALANLSTRYLVNAVEDVAYRCGIAITFQYNNNQAYSAFYAGVTPLLDTMKNVGAIEDYRVVMSADINGEDYVNSNTVIGKIWLVVNGVINDIYVDLIALPAGLGIDLNSLS